MKTDETNWVRNPQAPPRQTGAPGLEQLRAVGPRDPGEQEADAFELWRAQRRAASAAGEGGGRGGRQAQDAYARAGRRRDEAVEPPARDRVAIHGLDVESLPAPAVRALDEMGEEIAHLNEALAAAAARIDRLEETIEHDSLTGLLDRAGLLHEIAHVQSLDAREGARSTIALIDLTPAPEVRRRFGRPAMERLLRETADALRTASEPGEALAHLGEGEFAIILPGRFAEAAETRLRTLLSAALAEPFRVESARFDLDASVGLAAATPRDPQEGEAAPDPEAVLAAADRDLRSG
ncbi:MAG: GGDEF domain-containing protein [Marivibrio sp.]|uniref:GGDEF domain-containing protein n=1 Tax=Marivibrio sp. TaxID=2039719 RepID=UPI0032F054A2